MSIARASMDMAAAMGLDVGTMAEIRERGHLNAETDAAWKAHRVEVGARLPAALWRCVELTDDGGYYMADRLRLTVICSICCELDGQLWIHASVSRYGKKLATYEDMALVKRLFIGESRTAYQLFVPPSKHVNLIEYVLHLWSRLDGQAVTPDFTHGVGSI